MSGGRWTGDWVDGWFVSAENVRISWGLPLSKIEKSLCDRPVRGFPCLSLTTTLTWTRREETRRAGSSFGSFVAGGSSARDCAIEGTAIAARQAETVRRRPSWQADKTGLPKHLDPDAISYASFWVELWGIPVASFRLESTRTLSSRLSLLTIWLFKTG